MSLYVKGAKMPKECVSHPIAKARGLKAPD